MSTTDKRPQWDIPDISETDFRIIQDLGPIRCVENKMELIEDYRAKHWLEATNNSNKTIKLPSNWDRVLVFTGTLGSWPGLFRLNHLGKRCADRLAEIDRWEKINSQELALYKKLKAKYES